MRKLDELQALDLYDEMLDDVYANFMDIYPASRVLKEVDPIAYQVGFNDWCDSEEIEVN